MTAATADPGGKADCLFNIELVKNEGLRPFPKKAGKHAIRGWKEVRASADVVASFGELLMGSTRTLRNIGSGKSSDAAAFGYRYTPNARAGRQGTSRYRTL